MPYETYNHSTGATAVIGGPFYNATAYPQQYRGNYFYADYTGNFIKRVVFDVAHNPVGIQTFATNVAAPVSLAVGPEGFIYYLSFTTGDIRRIRPSGPAAAATATPRYGMSPLTVSFSSAGTTNPAAVRPTTGPSATGPRRRRPTTHTYTVSGVQTFTATLKVTDSAGVSSTATVDVTVNSTPSPPSASRSTAPRWSRARR